MFNQQLERSLVTAVREAKNHRHEFVTVEHLLYGLLHDELASRIITQCGGSFANLKKRLEEFFDDEMPTQKMSDTNDPIQTLGFNRVLQRAIGHVQSCQKKEVDSGDVLVAIFSEPESHAVYFLSSEGLDRVRVVEYISHGLPDDLEMESWGQPQKKKKPKEDALSKFTVNFADRAKAGLIDPLIGREQELERIMQVLCRRRKNNPLLVGEPGVGKTAIAEGLALHIHEGNVPSMLQDVE
ncbi:MAG: ATP-dependent Clp protease ATP-binding subunit ClpA, partial [Proteobacteria bacterium]|nr:ATP-dependent Clp protease ATP-binding subunit ClpA [Pseudomonadota bacterium]